MPIRTLVVDDSSLYRGLLRKALSQVPGLEIEIVGNAPNGRIALRKIEELRPDLVTLDLEMPELDGLGVLRELSALSPPLPKILVVSAHTEAGARKTIDALALGAHDFVTKNSQRGRAEENLAALTAQLADKMTLICGQTRSRAIARLGRRESVAQGPPPQVVVLGISTGGPNALTDLFRELPRLPVPVLIVQHMPPTFTAMLAQRLSTQGVMRVHEATEGMIPRPGEAYLAPGDFHMEVRGDPAHPVLHIHQGPRERSCRPAADVLFRSAASVYGRRCLAVVMTGMGNDGTTGAEVVHQAGGAILTQSAESCVVYGMPRSIHESGLPYSDHHLHELASVISERCQPRRRMWTA